MRLRAALIALVAVLATALAGCGSSAHVWVGPAQTHRFASASISPFYAETLHWSGVSIANQTGFYVYENGTQVGSPTSSPYVFQRLACGTMYTLGVRAHDGSGNTSPLASVSYTTPSCNALAPQNTAQPYFAASTVSSDACTAGCAIQGQTLGVSTGTWSGSPTSYSYQWQRCSMTDGQPPTVGTCTNISGATSSTYTVTSSDVGKALAATVTATNSAGSTSTVLSGSCNEAEAYVMWLATSPAFPAGCSPLSAVAATSNAGETYCTNAISTCGYPDPGNQTVGVPAGTTLTPYSGPSNITTAGTVINGAEFTSPITINASNVTIENSDFDENWSQTSSTGAINVSGSVTGVTIQYDTFHGTSDTANGLMFAAVYSASNYSAGTNHVTVDHVYFYDGMRILHGPGTAQNSYCVSNLPSNGSHMECVYEGGGSTTLDHNTLLQVGPLIPCGSGSPCAGPIYLSTDFASEGTETVTNNLLAGGNYTIYGGAPSGSYTAGAMTYTGNRFSNIYYTTCGIFGQVSYLPSSGYTWSGNVNDDTGTAVAS